MGPTNIESLHTELMARVCQYLDETHPPSLVAFSRVNKKCYAIANIFLSRTIKFTVSDGQYLAQDVERWGTQLHRDSSFRHVRRLIFCWTKNKNKRHVGYSSLDSCERHEDESGLRAPWDLYYPPFPPSSETSITNDVWEQVARFMKQLTALVDVFYAYPDQFPPCLLRTLHAHFPRCRLHAYTFYMTSLKTESIDPHGLALTSSPCLYSIGELETGNHRLVWEFVRRRASRLKELHILLPTDRPIDFVDNDESSRWTGMDMCSPAPLEVFHLGDTTIPERAAPFSMVSWALYGDFSALRVLKLDSALTDLDGHLPAPNNFPALATLALTCARNPPIGYWNTLLAFLHDLPCLTTLQLREWDRLISIVSGLNPNLRKLDLSTRVGRTPLPLKDDHILQLADACPDLEDLAVEIRRSRGKAHEVSLYRALGRLRRLQYLNISLDASPPGLSPTVQVLDANGDSIGHGTAIEPWFDAEDVKTLGGPLWPHRQGHLKDVLVNNAIDSDLARSIFEVIDKAKAESSRATLPLEQLKLHTLYGEKFPQLGARPLVFPFIAALHRKWLVERDVRDDARDRIHVTEIDQKDRLFYMGSYIETVAGSRNNPVYAAWERVWPLKAEGSIWTESWRSLPLERDGEEAAEAIGLSHP